MAELMTIFTWLVIGWILVITAVGIFILVSHIPSAGVWLLLLAAGLFLGALLASWKVKP
jgi:hypothetical protein